MKNRRTPGPWKVLKEVHQHNSQKFITFHIVPEANPTQHLCCITLSPQELHREAEVEANFVLFATAPQLLDACKGPDVLDLNSPMGLLANKKVLLSVMQAEGLTNTAYLEKDKK